MKNTPLDGPCCQILLKGWVTSSTPRFHCFWWWNLTFIGENTEPAHNMYLFESRLQWFQFRRKVQPVYFAEHPKFLKTTYRWLRNLDLKFSKLKIAGQIWKNPTKCDDIPCIIMYLCAFTIGNRIVNIVQRDLQEISKTSQLRKFQIKIAQPSISRFQKFRMFWKVEG